MADVEIELVNEHADASELDQATRALRDDLVDLDGCTVTQPNAPAPAGTKGIDPAVLGQLLLATVGSGGIAVTVVSVVRDWLMRNKDYKLRIKRGETEVELAGANAQELKGLLADVKAMLVAETSA